MVDRVLLYSKSLQICPYEAVSLGPDKDRVIVKYAHQSMYYVLYYSTLLYVCFYLLSSKIL